VRQALNENPVVQAAILGVLAIVVAFLLLTRMGGNDSEPAPATDVSADASVIAAQPAVPDAGATPSAAEAQGPAEPTAPFKAGPGLPRKVVDAYNAGKAVVLLIVNPNGFDDRKLASHVGAAVGAGRAEIIVVPANEIADYSRITQGVDVERVPALIVIKPKDLAENPEMPEASVSYGYRGAPSIAQAVRDALYQGRENLPYHPE